MSAGEQREALVSIVVPTFQRPGQVRTLLEALRRQEYPRCRFEVVLVDDDHGRAELARIAEPFRQHLDITLLESPHAGCAGARQRGVEVAGGEFLAFTDDDCVPSPWWLASLVQAMDVGEPRGAGGSVVNGLERNLYAETSQLLVGYLHRKWNEDDQDARFFTTNNLGFPAAAFRELGGLDATWRLAGGEDRDLCDRWRLAGYRLSYEPKAAVLHAHHLNLRGFWMQQFNYGRGARRFRRRAARRRGLKLRMETLGFYIGSLAYPFEAMPPSLAGSRAALTFVAQLANSLGFVRGA